MKLVTATRNFAKYWFAAILAVACTVQESVETQAPKQSGPVVSSPYVEGQATVEFTEDLAALVEQDLAGGAVTKSASLDALLTDLNIESLERVFPYAGEFEERTRKAGLHRFYLVKFKDDIPATKAVVSLQSVPGIVSAEPSRKIKRRTTFDDPLLPRQWHFINSNRPGVDINVQEVWDTYTVGGSNVVVCVVDEPVDATHPDLISNLWMDSQGHTGYNFVRGNYDLSIRPPANKDSDGDSGHGTHVAGTIAAINGNGIGVCGIAGGDYSAGVPGVRIQSCAIFSGDKGASDPATANAIKFGADNGAVISQNSWGYYADTDDDGKVSAEELADFKKRPAPSALIAAIDYFITYAGTDKNGNQLPDSPMKGGLVFFAAGNENIDYDPIGTHEPVIAVGAFNELGSKASYSNYGSWVDIAAPAGEGTSAANSVWSTLPTNVSGGSSGYGGKGWVGTSMACPHASGVAALIVSYYGGDGFTADQAKEILFGGLGSPIGGSTPIGRKINALESFNYGGVMDSNPLSLGAREVTVHAHETRALYLTVRAEEGSTVTCTPGSNALVYDSATSTVTITGRNDQPGKYKAKFVLSTGGNEVYTLTFPYTLLPNHAPEVSLGSYVFEDISLRAIGVSHLIPRPADLGVLFVDDDGEQLVIKVENSNPEVATIDDTDGKFNVKSAGYGITTITVSGTDGLGERAAFSFKIAVKDPSKGTGSEVVPEVATDTISVWPASQKIQKYSIVIYSASGAKVLSLEASGGLFMPIDIDITNLAPGVYTAHVTPHGGSTQKLKFVKY